MAFEIGRLENLQCPKSASSALVHEMHTLHADMYFTGGRETSKFSEVSQDPDASKISHITSQAPR